MFAELRRDVRFTPAGLFVSSWWEEDLSGLASLEPFDRLELYGVDRRWDLSGLENLDGVIHLKLAGANLGSSAQWNHVSRLKNLTHLSLDGSNITDDALRHIGRLNQLKRLLRLQLSLTHITNDGLTHLAALKSLQHQVTL